MIIMEIVPVLLVITFSLEEFFTAAHDKNNVVWYWRFFSNTKRLQPTAVAFGRVTCELRVNLRKQGKGTSEDFQHYYTIFDHDCVHY